ncbi:MAG: hypothetical protein N3C59_07880 [Azovibrio sp.]|nr:hypothetical protein [Azovibrio sp.]
MQGEFEIPEGKLYEGLTKSLGALRENPAMTIDPPSAKAIGKFSGGAPGKCRAADAGGGGKAIVSGLYW